MRLHYAVIFMIIASFMIQYIFMSMIMTNDLTNVKNSLSKVYLSSIMGITMGIIEVVMYDVNMSRLSLSYYIPLVLSLLVFIYLYRAQVFVTDKEYLNEMIEHHSMALLTSGEILKKTHSYKVSKIAQTIKQTQQDEIRIMQDTLDSLTK